MNGTAKPQSSFWKSLSVLDWVALALAAFAVFTILSTRPLPAFAGSGLLRFAGLLAIFYLLYRFWSRWRNELLWSLRNRLIVAYIFIAIVPVVLILIFASLLGQIIYSQLGAYLLYHDVEDRLEMLADSSAGIAAVESSMPENVDPRVVNKALAEQVLIAEAKELPGLVVTFDIDPESFYSLAGEGHRSFTGLVQTGPQLNLVAIRQAQSPRGSRVISLSVPVTSEFLEQVAPDLGPIDVTLAETVAGGSGQSAVQIGGKDYRRVGRIKTERRTLSPAESSMDPVVEGFSQLKATYVDRGRVMERDHPVFAFFTARRSNLNHRIFTSLGELGGARVSQLQVIGAVFLLIELAALLIGAPRNRCNKETFPRVCRSNAATSSACSASPSIP